MRINIPETEQKRIVIVGGGFAGLKIARMLRRSGYLIVLVDKNNYHQFQPLFYQVATAGLEPSSIIYPLRKMFQNNKNVYIRITEVTRIDPQKKQLSTPLGVLNYDYLVLATGADTNFFGNKNIAANAIPMKSVAEALYLRNEIFSDYENALTTTEYEERQTFLDVVVVGGGPTGVEVAGALAEMKQQILPKDYPELDCNEIDIHLLQGGPTLLQGMSKQASDAALKYLTALGVHVKLDARVVEYDGNHLVMEDGSQFAAKKVIWAAGVRGSVIPGLPEEVVGRGNRLLVNRFHQVHGLEDVFAIGDIAFMTEEKYPEGHPQVAQVAIQQAKNLGKNFMALSKKKPPQPFSYLDLGAMATIGRNRAVADLPAVKMQGTLAWFVWLFIHLLQLIGFKNKLFVFLNWVWNYFTYDQSLRLIIRPRRKPAQSVQGPIETG